MTTDSGHGSSGRPGALVAGLALVLAVATPGPAAAQRPVRIDGTVQWISGQTLVLLSDQPSAALYTIGRRRRVVPATV